MASSDPGGPALTGEQLAQAYASPSARAVNKVQPELDQFTQRFIELSPYCVLASTSREGPEVSPRGGPPGFVEVVDSTRLRIADRPGNNRLDTYQALLADPRIAILFLVPGMDETLRVYGEAMIRPPESPQASPGASKSYLDVRVSRVFFHCAKASMRAGLWDPASQVERSALPPLGEILKAQTGDPEPAETQEEMLRRYRPLL